MLKIRDITQMGIQASHYLNDVFCRLVSFFLVLDCGGLVNQFLQMTAVFRND